MFKKEERKKNRKKYIIIGIVALVVVCFVGVKAAGSNAKMPVTAVAVSKGDVESSITTSGKVESDVTKTYYTQIGGNIDSIPVKLGQAVKNGDVLLYFEEESLAVARKDAEASALSSESSYNDSVNQNSKTQAKLNEANINLEVLEKQITGYTAFIKEQERKLEDTRNAKKASLSAWGRELAKEQADGEDVEEEMADYQYALETLDMNRELVDIQRTIDDAKEMLAGFEEYEAEMKSQKAATEDNVMSAATKEAKALVNEAEQLKSAQVLDYTNMVSSGLKSDMDGIITQMHVTEGSPVTSGAALLTIASNDQVHVTVNLSKADLAKVKEGQRADVTIAGNTYEGKVSFINHMATTNANNMPVVEAQISITNADENVYLGIEAKVVIYAQKSENVLLVPVEAVNSDKNGDFVYIIENGIVVRKDVETGVSSDNEIEIVSGIKEKDQIITDISLDLVEGMEVTVISDMLPQESTDAEGMNEEESAESE